uniref:Uncharacterized protein n=1 Tax=viral metagenome TaxID=1070528 RepID=A0A6C0DQI7_9ZZZZ
MKIHACLLFFITMMIILLAFYSPKYLPITIIGYKYADLVDTPPSQKRENMESNIRFFNLVLYSSGSDEYDNMKRITEEYYKNFSNVKTVYYTFSETLEEPYKLENNVLFIKGKESYVPGITDKTKLAFSYFKDEYNHYDYVVRSNISTIINFELLTSELAKQPIDYGSGLTFSVESIDVDKTDEKIYDVNFASGTSIIMSKNVINRLVEKVDLVRSDIIDDVAIGIFIKDHLPDIKMIKIVPEKYTYVPDYHGEFEKVYDHLKNKDFIFYRNRNDTDRKIDGTQMSQIVKIIS